MTMLPVILDQPRPARRGRPTRRRTAMPPRHLADLDLAGRRGAPSPSWASRRSAPASSPHHYFGRLVRDPAAMTDLPGRDPRPARPSDLLPTLLTPVRELACDDGATRKTLWRLHDGALVESVLMGYPDRVTVCVSSQAGLRHGLPVLRHRPGRA